MPEQFSLMKTNIFNDVSISKGEKFGVEIDKGFLLNEDYLVEHEKEIQKLLQFYSAYPDLFIDRITKSGDNFKLFFYQRIFLRAIMRFNEVYVVAPRAWSKSFITILGIMLQCIFTPGSKRFICAPYIRQAARIAKEKIIEIFDHFPILKKEIVGWELSDTPGNYGPDYTTLKFRNGSIFDVVGATDSTRGGRRTSGLIDEVRDADETEISEIVIPLINVARRLPDNTVNPNEQFNQQIVFATSAGLKNSFAYNKLIDLFENSIINPKETFVFGNDYRIPMMHGLLSKNFVDKLKMSPSFNIESFQREYASQWSGSSNESWFSFDHIMKYRKIKNPETKAKYASDNKHFYLLSIDVGRLHDQTVVCVFRVTVLDNKYYSTLVNLYVLARQAETKTFERQCIDIKRIIQDFNPKEVVIDINGLGIGLGDLMIQEQVDENGIIYPAYGFMNNEDYKKVQPKSAPRILYGIKANGPLNSKIHSNCYTRLSEGRVRFLIKEQEAKSSLLATKKGQKMTPEERIKRLMPHEMTTKLFYEMANLRARKTGNGMEIALEQINSNYPKDKYSAFAYGLWRIKELEEENFKKTMRFGSTGKNRKLVFFTEGGKN